MTDVLKGLTDSQIRKAATFWLTAAQCFQRGEAVPAGVFALSIEGLTQSDIEWVASNLPCSRVDGDECCFFEKNVSDFCLSCQAHERTDAFETPEGHHL